MALTSQQFSDLVSYLREHPEAAAELRPIVTGPEILSLPSRMDRVEAALVELANQAVVTNERIDLLTERIDRLTERLDKLAETVAGLASEVGRFGNLAGGLLEGRYARDIRNWLSEYIDRPVQVWLDDLALIPGAIDSHAVEAFELTDVRRIDLLIEGKSRESGDASLLACELSTTIHEGDIERALRRAAVLRRGGYDVLPFVGGYAIDERLRSLAVAQGVIVDIREPAA